MSDDNSILSPSGKWLVQTWLEKLAGVIEGMADQRPATNWTAGGNADLSESSLVLEQRVASVAEPVAWIAIPEAVHQDLGGRVLVLAGLDTAGDDEKKSTCLEIVEQSLGGLTGVLTKTLGRELRREAASPCESFPNGAAVARVTLSFGGTELPPMAIAFSSELISWIEDKQVAASAAKPGVREDLDGGSNMRSSTFDLLLDVSLPVSVSFGKAEVPVKEVLKLTTGSIVELNRSISEPVDIIVNGCTIARGEVVVVEGNYGVRIQSIISRQDRLRTGAAAAEARSR